MRKNSPKGKKTTEQNTDGIPIAYTYICGAGASALFLMITPSILHSLIFFLQISFHIIQNKSLVEHNT